MTIVTTSLYASAALLFLAAITIAVAWATGKLDKATS